LGNQGSNKSSARFAIAGPPLQQLIIGGVDYGHHTLTRFFALHAGVIPGMIVALLVGHIYLFRRHGLTAKLPLRKLTLLFGLTRFCVTQWLVWQFWPLSCSLLFDTDYSLRQVRWERN
jgi:quinol-cytochrome oxidoreductase complex cytochrome b subunit